MALLGYARVSRDDQDPARQHDALAAAGVAHERVWTDHGVSGALASRPQLDALLAYARDGDVIVVHDRSRLGRSLRNLVVLVDDLAGRGISVRSLSQGIDTTNGPTGTILLSLLAALAEIERTILVERTRDDLAAARSEGPQSWFPTSGTACQRPGAARCRSVRRLGFSRPTHTSV